MNLKKDNRIVVDLGKVQFARFFYTNQYNNFRNTLPAWPTVRNSELKGVWDTFRAGILGLIDEWYPCTLLKLQANHSLTYTGEKAKSIWKEWNRRIFNQKRKSS
jgi:hypothetical protein